MGFFDIFKRSTEEKLLIPPEKKSYLATLENPASLFTLDNTFEGRGKQGYLSNPYVFACIDQRAANLAALPICIKLNDQAIYDHEILNMFNNVFYGNCVLNQYDFFYRLSAFLDISGNAYIWGDSATSPTELVLYDPSDVSIDTSSGKVVYSIGQTKIDQEKNLFIHIANFNPSNKIKGAAPTEPADLSIDTNNAGRVYNSSLMQKHTKISGILKGTAGSIPDDVRQAFKDQFTARYSGAANSGSVMFTSGDIEYTETQMRPVDMDWLNAMTVSGKEIGMTFKVPPELLGIGKATYENVKEARLYFIRQVVAPQLEKILESFNRSLVSLFDSNLKLKVDYEKIEAIKEFQQKAENERLTAASQVAVNLYNAGIIERDEARKIVGVDEEEEAQEEYERTSREEKRRSIAQGQRRRMNRYIKEYTEPFKKALQKEFRKQRKETLKAYEENENDMSLFKQKINQLGIEWKENLEKIYRKQKQDSVFSIAKRQQRSFQKDFNCRLKKSIDNNDEEIQQFIDSFTAENVQRVNDTTKEQIRQIVESDMAEGDFIGIFEKIDNLFLDQIIPNRTETIARTETHQIANFASLKAAKELDIVVKKQWSSSYDDGRIRETHIIADGQLVELKRNFTVGGSSLEFPGDQKGPAEEVINCRCVMDFIEEDDF